VPADLSRVPFPVAYPLHFARSTTLNVTDRRNNAIFACYQAVRLTALLLLADYVCPDELDTDERLTHHIRGLVQPHWGDWTNLADALAAFWSQPGKANEEQLARPDRAMFPEPAVAWQLISRSPAGRAGGATRDAGLDSLAATFPGAQGTARARCLNDAVATYRNDVAHRTGTVTPHDEAAQASELERFLPLAEAFVSRLFGAGHFTLIRAVRAPGRPLQVIHLDGPHPDLKFTPVDPKSAWIDDLAPTDVVAVAGDRSIPVYPMFVPTHDDQAQPLFGLEDPVAMIDQVSERRLVLLGVKKAAPMPDKHAHLAAALQALRSKNVDVAFTRSQVKPWKIDAWSRHTARLTLDQLTDRKYFPRFYLERPNVDGALDRLAGLEGGALLLLGDAGSGKSSLIARLAERLLVEHEVDDAAKAVAQTAAPSNIVVWLTGRADYATDTTTKPGCLLIEAVNRKLGIMPGQFASVHALLQHLDGQRAQDLHRDRKIWLLLDGLNEAERFVDLVTEIDTLLPCLPAFPHVRLAVSMRSGAYHSLAARAASLLRSGAPVFSHFRHFMAFPDETGTERNWLNARPFHLETEGAAAYRLRQSELPGRASGIEWERLDRTTRLLLLRPLYLHLFHLIGTASDAVPRNLTENDLLDAYLDSLGGEAEGSVAGLGEWLARLGEEMLARRSAFLPIEVAEAWRAEWLRRNHFDALSRAAKLDPVEELVSASVLLRPVDQAGSVVGDRLGYGFTQQKLAERLLLRTIDWHDR
jgi:hypothetical protein